MTPNLRRFLVAYFFYSFALYGAFGFISIYLKQLGASGLEITGSFSMGVLFEILVMGRSGRFSDRFGRRPALVIAFLVLPIRLLLYVPATGPIWITFVNMLHGLNFGIVGAVTVAFANDLAADRTYGHAQSRLAAVMGFASAIGPIALGIVAHYAGLRAMFGVASIIASFGAAGLFFGVEDSHQGSASIADRAPTLFRPVLRWFDHPPNRRN
jgi:MFS transporter, PPP family, 3-phenylpropionic acid transporter